MDGMCTGNYMVTIIRAFSYSGRMTDTKTRVDTTSCVMVLCTYLQLLPLDAISLRSPPSMVAKEMPPLASTGTKIVDTGGYNYKVFRLVIIQVFSSKNYQAGQHG
ncbi:uncharacterized protein LOC113318281 [Papaver somniferum]|nr:uncharacterized protein LOC113318281 [Papaver somniferum]